MCFTSFIIHVYISWYISQLVANRLLVYQRDSLATLPLTAMGMLCLEAPGRETAALVLAMASPSQMQASVVIATVSSKYQRVGRLSM